MKAGTLKLCIPIAAMTAQQSAAMLVIPPFLDDLKYPVSAIGTLISLGPVLAFTARLPSGMGRETPEFSRMKDVGLSDPAHEPIDKESRVFFDCN